MPELPEVEALARFLTARTRGYEIKRVDVASISVLKTYDPPPTALHGRTIDAVGRHGKFLDLTIGGLHLIVHLARAGWLHWRDNLPSKPLGPGNKSPVALRVALEDGSGFDLTEHGTKKRLAVYVVDDPAKVPGIATLGPDPLGEELDPAAFAALLNGKRTQIKGLMRDQKIIAGIGNAYSDEILHAAKMSPFKLANTLTDNDITTLYNAMITTLREATTDAGELAAGDLKAHKKETMRVHGRTGQPCPVCGDTIREVSFADSSLQYCPTCQTGGKPLADRRMSRLLK
ncbi:Fpg/Nei family DNA glycosylase [Phytomonospora endophytica]|uniref:Formamidopyrimidine-DNA glycosylase n=1 Tax=Phytomonospora endophytica TaxID=714109 RepID=A0A841FJ05_9ACTN|nr:Fpg/Nei family DNA glycosylase [Phytomonospora endophytica]MBB6035854.1 formamidopyrimidine-DNA glycosylase [Phytomonospora endophytica]GIG71533.1 formamidopyrimidine-DNA glycosylase [Phytomonospora endophytica]